MGAGAAFTPSFGSGVSVAGYFDGLGRAAGLDFRFNGGPGIDEKSDYNAPYRNYFEDF